MKDDTETKPETSDDTTAVTLKDDESLEVKPDTKDEPISATMPQVKPNKLEDIVETKPEAIKADEEVAKDVSNCAPMLYLVWVCY